MLTVLVALYLGICQIIFANPLEQQIDQFLSQQHFQGAVLVATKGTILHCKGYGYANAEHQIFNTPDTVFRIASLTKQFTAVAILKLQEKGFLSVNDPIEKYLPSYPRGDEITIHHLLTHTSGIAEITDFPNLSNIQRLPSSPELVMSYFQDIPLQFTPGSKCLYCNSGYIVLGAIIEAATGHSYERYIEENFFTPLGLQCTFYDHHQSIIPNRASGYCFDEDGNLAHAAFIEMSFPHAAGGLVSTVKDLYTWNLALHSGQLLSQASQRALLTMQASDGQGKLTYGYGLCIGPQNENFNTLNVAVIGHFGTIEGFKAALVYYPEADATLIFLSNLENSDLDFLQTRLATFIHHISYWR
jgi:CubicO group peptidase (beta-lactamase class C family)